MKRLYLLGDAEVCDHIAELTRFLSYDEVHRGAEAPAKLSREDDVVVAMRQPSRGRELLARVLGAGDPGYLGLVAPENEAMIALLKLSADRFAKARLDRISAPAGHSIGATTAGELAIAVAAELIASHRRVPD